MDEILEGVFVSVMLCGFRLGAVVNLSGAGAGTVALGAPHPVLCWRAVETVAVVGGPTVRTVLGFLLTSKKDFGLGPVRPLPSVEFVGCQGEPTYCYGTPVYGTLTRLAAPMPHAMDYADVPFPSRFAVGGPDRFRVASVDAGAFHAWSAVGSRVADLFVNDVLGACLGGARLALQTLNTAIVSIFLRSSPSCLPLFVCFLQPLMSCNFW